MLSRQAHGSHVGFGSALGNKWIILDALPYLRGWVSLASSLSYSKRRLLRSMWQMSPQSNDPHYALAFPQEPVASSLTSAISCGQSWQSPLTLWLKWRIIPVEVEAGRGEKNERGVCNNIRWVFALASRCLGLFFSWGQTAGPDLVWMTGANAQSCQEHSVKHQHS